MKNEPWIDRVYKEKTESWKIPFEAAHWEQAAALIDDQNQKKKKRILWFWVLGLVLLLASLFVVFLPFKNQKEVSPQSIPAVPAAEPMAGQTGPVIPMDPTIQNTITDPAAKLDLNSVALTGLLDTNTRSELRNKLISTNDVLNRQDKQTTQETFTVSTESLLPQITDVDQSEILIVNKIEDANKSKAVNPLSRRIDEVSLLQFHPIVMIDEEQSLQLPEILIPILIEQHGRNWKEFGLRIGLAKQTQAVRTNAISALGLEVFTQKQLGNKGYWGISLGYNSFFNPSLYSEVLTAYQFKGFGSVVQNFGIKPEWMHYLYLQASMGFQLKKHRAFMGVKPELLLGALGKVDQIKFKEGAGIKDLATAEVSRIGNGWLQKGALHQVLFNTQLGYEYQVHPKVNVGVQANRHLNSLYKPLPGDITQSNVAKWNIGMRVSYKIK